MIKYDLVMFDMDGTIADSARFHQEVFYRFLNAYVGEITMEQVKSRIGATVREILESMDVPENEHEALFAELDNFCRTQIDDLAAQVRVAAHTPEMLAGLHDMGIKTALVTNSVEAAALKILGANGIYNLFDCISGADFYSTDKAGRCRIVQEKLRAEKVLYVGDAERDIVLANKMKYDSCFAMTELAWYEDAGYIIDELKPTIVVEKLSDILDRI